MNLKLLKNSIYPSVAFALAFGQHNDNHNIQMTLLLKPTFLAQKTFPSYLKRTFPLKTHRFFYDHYNTFSNGIRNRIEQK